MGAQIIIEKYQSYGIEIDEIIVKKALDFILNYRTTELVLAVPYPTLAEIITAIGLDYDLIITEILYAPCKNTHLSVAQIDQQLNKKIAKFLSIASQLIKNNFRQNHRSQIENCAHLVINIIHDTKILLLKLADYLYNLRNINFVNTIKEQQQIACEGIKIYAPLAEKMGMQDIKNALQDIGFKIINPEKQTFIRSYIANHYHGSIEQTILALKKIICANVAKADIYGRRKTAYSTWMKMQKKHINIDQLSDIIAFRIILKTTEDCYRVLHILHATYQIIPNDKVKDFIKKPKLNGYQSMHIVVKGLIMLPTEIQIRTDEMHNFAEFASAAHWRYKQHSQDVWQQLIN